MEELECSQGSGAGVGLSMSRPYAPTGAGRLDSENWETFEKHTRAMSVSANID